MAYEWLERTLVVGPYLQLCLSQEEFDEISEELNLPRCPFVNPGAAATAHHYEGQNNQYPISIVCINRELALKHTGVQVAGILVHEAMHVWRNFREWIGESHPSTEFEAYAMQNIAQELMQAYANRIYGATHEALRPDDRHGDSGPAPAVSHPAGRRRAA